jgi:hypothetical protein
MTDSTSPGGEQTAVPEEDFDAAFGGGATVPAAPAPDLGRKRRFAPWHLPVKQAVRQWQWADLTKELLVTLGEETKVLRYFTLPGPDLLDVRVISKVCAGHEAAVELFGFDTAVPEAGYEAAETGATTELDRAALRQAGRIVGDSTIVRGRLEAIAIENSQEANQLQLRWPFHVVNIDGCNHLTYRRGGGVANLFDALKHLMIHQLTARTPWLLFITTRCQPEYLSDARTEFEARISENRSLSDEFTEQLATLLGTSIDQLDQRLAQVWGVHDTQFVKLYCVGLGKFILQWFNGQAANPAKIELASAYAYRVASQEPDMLSLAFRVTPLGQRVFPPSTGGMVATPALEPQQAMQIVRKADRLWDLDLALGSDSALLGEVVGGTEDLLREANFDLDAWREYVDSHPRGALVPPSLGGTEKSAEATAAAANP